MTCPHGTLVELALIPGEPPIRCTRCVTCGMRFRTVYPTSAEFARETRQHERLVERARRDFAGTLGALVPV